AECTRGPPRVCPPLDPPAELEVDRFELVLPLCRQRVSASRYGHHVGDELGFPVVEVANALVAVHRHVAWGRKLWRAMVLLILATQLVFGMPFAFFDPGLVDLLHLSFAQRAIAGVLDAVTEVIKIGTESVQCAN